MKELIILHSELIKNRCFYQMSRLILDLGHKKNWYELLFKAIFWCI